MVERGELDLTFWTLPVAPGPYESVELLRDPYVLVVPAGSPLAALKRTPTLKEIALQPLIGFNHCRAMDEVEAQLASSGPRSRTSSFAPTTTAPCRASSAPASGSASRRSSPWTRTTRASR